MVPGDVNEGGYVQFARNALVAGGTGLVGTELLKLLAEERRYGRITSLVRRETVATGRVENRIVLFDDLDRSELLGVDDAYCCLGTTRRVAGSDDAFRKVDFDYVLAYARAAQRAGAVRFLLVSAMGAKEESRFLYTRVKGQVEAAVNTVGFQVVGIARPSFLIGRRGKARAGETAALIVSRAMAPIMVGPFRRFRPIEARTVAAALIHLAFNAREGVSVLSSEQIASAAQSALVDEEGAPHDSAQPDNFKQSNQ
jgi:uncharacterized protein YbjT (DUF2867 family)